jgi:Zn-finger nucleic acid-binding protein
MGRVGELAEPRCPACGALLAPSESRWHVLACNACGGVWTDSEAARHIATAVDRELVGLAKEVASHAKEDVRLSMPGTPRPCPVCQRALQEVRAARVNVDVCSEHGAWFDRDELGRLARNLEFQRRETPPPVGYRESAIPESENPHSSEMLLALLGPAPRR